MTFSTVASAAGGFNAGTLFATAERKKAEVEQGGTGAYQAVLSDEMKAFSVANTVHQVSRYIPNPYLRLSAQGLNTLMPVVTLFALPTAEAVKQGSEKGFLSLIKEKSALLSPRVSSYIPEELGRKTKKCLQFLSRHFDKVMSTAMIASGIALPVLGQASFALAMSAPFIYQKLDDKGFVPINISVFMERKLPTVLHAFGLLGSPLTAVFSALALATYVDPINQALQNKLSKMISNQLHLEGPTLEEFKPSLCPQRSLNLAEIEEILEGKEENYELNPAHLASGVDVICHLPQSSAFKLYLTCFKAIDWEALNALVFAKLKEDDRFIKFLKNAFPQEKGKPDFKEKIQDYIQRLAEAAKCSVAKFLANYLTQQMAGFVQILRGELPVKGSKKDLLEAIENSSKILPYLLQLSEDVKEEQLEREEILLQLAVEAGQYCGLGLKLATQDILSDILHRSLNRHLNPSEVYEVNLLQTLQSRRQQMLDNFYVNEIVPRLSAEMIQDRHTYDLYRKCLALGFVPLTQFERESFSAEELFMWQSPPPYPFRSMRPRMYRDYRQQLNTIVDQLGELEFGIYLANLINKQEHLTEEQKEDLIAKYTDCWDGTLSKEEARFRFHRLVFIMLGILRPTAAYLAQKQLEEWEVIESTTEEESKVVQNELNTLSLIEDYQGPQPTA